MRQKQIKEQRSTHMEKTSLPFSPLLFFVIFTLQTDVWLVTPSCVLWSHSAKAQFIKVREESNVKHAPCPLRDTDGGPGLSLNRFGPGSDQAEGFV